MASSDVPNKKQGKNRNDNVKRHAYLILAHTDVAQLKCLLAAIDDERNDIYIHLDSKWKDVSIPSLENYVKKSGIFFIKRIHAAWGGSSLIQAELNLITKAYHKGEYSFYHLLSGQDLPVKSQDFIHDFFDRHPNECFLQPGKWEINSRFRMRYEQYHFLQNKLIGKKRNFWKYIEFAFCYIQKFLGIRRFKNVKIRAAYQWFSLPENAVSYLAQNAKTISRNWRFTYCCDELFVPTELNRGGFTDTFSSLGGLRFIEWQKQGPRDISPRYLNMGDDWIIENPQIMFARKFREKESNKLIEELSSNWERHEAADTLSRSLE